MTDTPASRKVRRLYRSDVRAAKLRLGGRTRVTPVFHTEVSGPHGPVKVSFKLEYLQHGGTFKVRGSLNALLESRGDTRPVVIASGGNAGIAAALACALENRPCTVVVPESAPHTKVAAMWAYGAEVLWHGTTYAEAYRFADELTGERGAIQLHAYDLPAVVAGAGVVGLEIEQQVRGRQPVLVAVGGGGLAAGIAAALGARGRVVGVEPKGAPTLHSALAAGRAVDVHINSIAADALGATRIGRIPFEIAQRYRMASVLVTDDAIAMAREYLWREFRIIVEPAGATALAAIQSGAYVPEPDERPVVVLCGANTDPTTL
ncbi:threonine/serine dehydratase [Nocardia sp. CDC159]|uniref:Threonine/serine dehydratase n=1 Tax=Nocardia pulmonis TaxID=2951408 RepID=A0A9X2EDY4_9NOCA|nr:MULTISPECIES: threonine/serine dehydratase [Nocardia]MCM6777690.1 threonine/serine dehydratase [Nocardia pulmonis]MCM6790506.1 threonine/serine dehydratase [Nocardia sp. CDC159]